MKDRVKELRKSLGLSQEAFGKRIGITKASVSQIELGTNSASNATVKCIASEFGVSEDWLRNGTGSMYPAMSRAEMAAQIVGAALNTDNEFVINTFIALGRLTPDKWAVVQELVNSIKSS